MCIMNVYYINDMKSDRLESFVRFAPTIGSPDKRIKAILKFRKIQRVEID